MKLDLIYNERQDIYQNCESYTAFPDANDFFDSDFEKQSLLPLGVLKVELNRVRHDVLIAAPIGDDEGRIGQRDLGEFCSGLWLTYTKNTNGKWALDCLPEDLLSFDRVRNDVFKSYNDEKNRFLESGYVLSNQRKQPRFAIFSVGGDEANIHWNWYSRVKGYIPHRLEDVPGHEHDKAKQVILGGMDGNDYMYLGTVEASVYSRPLMPTIRVFYNPIAKRVLVIHDYS